MTGSIVNAALSSAAHSVAMSFSRQAFSKTSPVDRSAQGAMRLIGFSSDEGPSGSHLQRSKDVLLDAGDSTLADTDLLALTLEGRVGDQDPYVVSEALLARFGDFNRVVSAPDFMLEERGDLPKEAVVALKLMKAAAKRLARSRMINRNVISCRQALLDYCHTALAHSETEQFCVLFLNAEKAVIADEIQPYGTVDSVAVYPREIIRRALQLNASSMILVHNHPSGNVKPSAQDISFTNDLLHAVKTVGLSVYDHLILGKGRQYSFRDEGRL